MTTAASSSVSAPSDDRTWTLSGGRRAVRPTGLLEALMDEDMTTPGLVGRDAALDAFKAARDPSPNLGPGATERVQTFRGAAEVLRFLRTAGPEFSYPTELIGEQRIDDTY